MLGSDSLVGGFFSRLFSRTDGCSIQFLLDGKEEKDRVVVDINAVGEKRQTEQLHLYAWDEPVSGRVRVSPDSGTSVAHEGIVVQLIGSLCLPDEDKLEFMRLERRFEADTLTEPTEFDFRFAATKPYESFRGCKGRVTYTLRTSVLRAVKNTTAKQELWVVHCEKPLPAGKEKEKEEEKLSFYRETSFTEDGIAMNVGVSDMLHVEFLCNRRSFHLRERVMGRVTFKVAELDLQSGEVQLVRKEFFGITDEDCVTQVMGRLEVMDGTPIIGESVPVRLYLESIPRLTPTISAAGDSLRVRYYLHLALETGDGRRYFKQKEITLYRAPGQELVGLTNKGEEY